MSPDRPRRLVLLRHAKAEAAGSVVDELRPLALNGRRQCGEVGARLAAAGLVPELVLVSSAVRTRQTWDLVRGALGDLPAPDVVVTDALYEAGPQDVIELLQGVDERLGCVLVVGHEPTMSGTAVLLADPTPPVGDLAALHSGLPTAGYAVLDAPVWRDVERRALRLHEVVRPAR